VNAIRRIARGAGQRRSDVTRSRPYQAAGNARGGHLHAKTKRAQAARRAPEGSEGTGGLTTGVDSSKVLEKKKRLDRFRPRLKPRCREKPKHDNHTARAADQKVHETNITSWSPTWGGELEKEGRYAEPRRRGAEKKLGQTRQRKQKMQPMPRSAGQKERGKPEKVRPPTLRHQSAL